MSEISDISDAPPPPPPPVDVEASGDGDVPEEGDAGADVRNVGQTGADEVGDGDVPEPEHTTDVQATGAAELTDGDVGVRETRVEQPAVEPASAGQQPPGGTEPPRPVASGDSDRPESPDLPDPGVVEEQQEDPRLPDSPAASDPVAIEDSPTPVDHVAPSPRPDPNPEPEGTPVDPADDPSQGREAAETIEQVEAAEEAQVGTDEAQVGTEEAQVGTEEAQVGTEEAQVGTDDTSAGTARPDQSYGPEEEPTPLEQADAQQPPAPEASTDTDTFPDQDRTGAGEADQARAADAVPVPDGPDAGADDKAEPAEVSGHPAEARLAADVEESSPEAGSAGQLVEGAESDGASGTTGDAGLEEGGGNAVTEPAGGDARPQEPQDEIAVRDTQVKGEADGRQGDSGQPPRSIQERIRQAVGAARNWANDTYLGRRLAGRPMEPWKSNRALHRSLDGVRPPENAVVADLEKLGRGNGTIGYKDVNAKRRSDVDLINSVFAPRDGQYISTYVDNPGVIGQGNHRAEELLKRAKDPDNKNVEMTTPIFIHRVGETETGAGTEPKEQA
ncbi:hypothetical protein [Streptomyces sp. NPDC001508]|uniref:hypothetical protein n=1 Tax=Streptomyces sp. NPDC001508 TaxID=3154656 RepID=UPI003320E604